MLVYVGSEATAGSLPSVEVASTLHLIVCLPVPVLLLTYPLHPPQTRLPHPRP